jgi:hypothetical protein
MATIRIKVPNKVGEKETHPTTKYGVLDPHGPDLVDGKIQAPKTFLISRSFEGGELRGLMHHFEENRTILKVAYEDEWVVYKLIPDSLRWSDGPPHPDRLQLAVRICRTDGVEEPTSKPRTQQVALAPADPSVPRQVLS